MTSLSEISTRAPKSLNKEETKIKTEELLDRIAERQKILFAQRKYSLLIILQGLDASGKDGVIGHVFKGLNPLGVRVKAFRPPSEEEADHDFLWRVHQHAPAKGMISIFNRSHYEDVLVPRINDALDDETLHTRFKDINNFEQLLQNNGTTVLKFYLHVSREEQLERLNERKTNPEKFWKHNDGDWEARRKWKKFNTAYEDIFQKCRKPGWVIVPADQNWYKEYIVSKHVLEALEEMDLVYPPMKQT
jgi:PPK2 family polyphosphate:nucleotide phosphotransferase